MAHSPSVREVRSFSYVIGTGAEASTTPAVGRFYIEETKDAPSRSALVEVVAEYGFRLIDSEGNLVGAIAPGMWPFFKRVLEQAAEMHSPSCVEDCNTNIGPILVVPGGQ